MKASVIKRSEISDPTISDAVYNLGLILEGLLEYGLKPKAVRGKVNSAIKRWRTAKGYKDEEVKQKIIRNDKIRVLLKVFSFFVDCHLKNRHLMHSREVSKELNLSPSYTHRVIVSLAELGALQRCPKQGRNVPYKIIMKRVSDLEQLLACRASP